MSVFSRFATFLCLTAGLMAAASPNARADSTSSPGYFMPPSAKPHVSEHVGHPVPAPTVPAAHTADQAQQQLPPVPQLPALPAGKPPPTAVIGVLSVPDVMQQSTAAQGVQAIITGRQKALAADAEKARQKIQAEQEAINKERSKLSDSELEVKEQALQNEIAKTQSEFQARNQAIQNSGQKALGQIESMLIAVIRQEAQARGMNLILHREQVALNVNAFDITDDVVAQLNKLLPSVKVPPSVVTPGMVAEAQKQDEQAQGGQ